MKRMPSPLYVKNDDIKLLDDRKLVELLWQLVYLELLANGISSFESQVPLSIYIKDGGVDGLARWTEGPHQTDRFPSRHVGFQAKATDLTEAACRAEVKAKSGTLKPEVRRLVESGGVYILFLGRDCVEQSKHDRIAAIENGIREASCHDGGVPIEPGEVYIYDASEIASWVNLYPAAMARVFAYLGRGGGGAQTWGEVVGYPDFDAPFVEMDPKRGEIIDGLRQVSTAPRTVTRLLGSSGLGKTRLVLEAFRPPKDPATDPAQQERADAFCYLHPLTVADPASLILEWRRSRCAGIVVVDDCPIELHDRLAQEVLRGDSRLSLITIGHDLDATAYAGGSSGIFKIEPASEALIGGILDASFAELAPDDRRFITTDLAQGYPLMAIRVAEAKKADAPLSARLPPHVLKRLLGRQITDGSTAAKVIAACALFEQLGVEGDAASECEFVRSIFCPEVAANDFYAEIVAFEKSGAMGRYGRLVQVRPPPVAIRLAADWWEKCSTARAEQIVALEFPPALADAFCARLRMLKFVPALAEITQSLCGSTGPFGQAKVLSSDLGSQLFRAISEVNPEAAVRALHAAFSGYSTAALEQLSGTPRRNLVWALEKIAFWESAFSGATEFLSRLACAENERWSNNATGVLSRLFMVMLSGTQTPLSARLPALHRMSRSEDPRMRAVSVSAFDSALTTDNFVGTSGPEYQSSSGPLPQYRPKLWKEVFDYWAECLEELTVLVERQDENSIRAASVISNHIRGLVGKGRLDDLERAIVRVIGAQGVVWSQAVDAIKDTLKYDLSRDEASGVEAIQRVTKWLELLSPVGLSDKLRLLVTEPPHEHEEKEDGNWIDVAAQAAEQLGRECGVDWAAVLGELPSVMRGDQRQAYSFGTGLAEGSGAAPALFDALVSQLSLIPFEERNSSVISGWLSVVDRSDPGACDALFLGLAENSALSRSLPTIARGPKLNDSRVETIRKLLVQRVVEPKQLYGLSYGRSMSDVSVQEVASLNRALLDCGVKGAWVALDLLFMYAYPDAQLAQELQAEFAAILFTPGMLLSKSAQRHSHAFETVADRLIPASPTLATFLMEELLAAIRSGEGPGHHLTGRLTTVLLREQPEAVWEALKKALAGSAAVDRWRVTLTLGARGISRGERNPLSHVPLKLLTSWCEEMPDVAPGVIAELVNTLDPEKQQLSDEALMLLDKYGDDPEVLRQLAATMNSFSWSGSLVPFYDQQISALSPLLAHHRASVREWAASSIEFARERRRRAVLEDEERQAGRW
jgi:hypothetical protein